MQACMYMCVLHVQSQLKEGFLLCIRYKVQIGQKEKGTEIIPAYDQLRILLGVA